MKYKWVALTVTTVGSIMSSLDTTIVVIGLPTILNDLHATIMHGIWVITGYQLMLTVLLVLLGRLADMYGRVRLYNLGFVIFTFGSLLAGLSRNGSQLVVFRFIQGSGAALLSANSAAIITDAFPLEELGTALGTNMMAFNVGAVVGYTLGGAMITFLGWRSIFFINVPVGIFGTVWAYKRLKEVSVRASGQSFDYLGSVLYCAGLSVILLALTIGDPTSLRNILILVAGIAIFVAGRSCRKQAEIPDARPEALQNTGLCRGQSRELSELRRIQLRAFPPISVSPVDPGLYRFPGGRRPHPHGSHGFHPEPDQRAAVRQTRRADSELRGAGDERVCLVLVFDAGSAFQLRLCPGELGALWPRQGSFHFSQYEFCDERRPGGEARCGQRHADDPEHDGRSPERALVASFDDIRDAVRETVGNRG